MNVYDYLGTSLNSANDLNGTGLNSVYDVYGNEISFYQPRSLNLLYSTPISSGQSPQGMDMYGDYIFQFFSTTNVLKILRKSDYAVVSELPCTVMGHCNSMQFGPVEQANGFPLLYVSDSGRDSYDLFVVSADLNQVSLVDTITMPTDVGHYANAVFDFENHKIYTAGYDDHPRTVENNNITFCVLDMDNPSTILNKWTLQYLGVQNSMVWDGEHVFINCNTWDGLDFKVWVIDPTTGEIDDVYTFAKEYDSEFQGMVLQNGWLLVSKWVYKTISNVKTLFYEFYMVQL